MSAVHVLGVNHRITTPKYRFELIQTEPVSDRVKGITLKVAIYEGERAGYQHRDGHLRQHFRKHG